MLKIHTPDEIYPDLFEAVQTGHVFADSKTFVDSVPRHNPQRILEAFRKQRQNRGFDLATFVRSEFDIPEFQGAAFRADSERPVRQHIELLWDLLTRDAQVEVRHSSLIALPRPFIVPGGRFREIYYWDSYFTMLGLAASGRIETIVNMVDCFAYLIDKVGFIPNGNRSYFCTRSQLPVFALMVELLADNRNDANILVRYLPQLEKEYAFWMSGSTRLKDKTTAVRRVVLVDGGYLNRFWDDSDLPRQESYVEDIELAATTPRTSASLYRDTRAACESGWDFSSRWLADGKTMASIRTSQILPVDLNAAMYKLESVLAVAAGVAGDAEKAQYFQRCAEARKNLLQTIFFDKASGFFVDLLLPDLRPTNIHSLAGVLPLFFQLASTEQASRVAEKIQQKFLKPGGWVTTLNHSGQQWDAPNGWAPSQWIVYSGLLGYGFEGQAREGARRWVENNLRIYHDSGKLVEKYDVENPGHLAGGGEYAVQDGFGWTNGVLLRFLDELDLEKDAN